MSNFFQERENEGRNKFEKMFQGYTYTFTEEPYERYDAFLQGKNQDYDYVVEIKNVHRDFKKYDDFTVDSSKIESIKSVAKEKDTHALLCGFFDDYTVVWDVTYLEPEVSDMWCTSTTADYEHGSRLKKMAHLTENNATYIKKNDSRRDYN